MDIVKPIHFLRNFLARDRKFMLPKQFVREYGNGLSESALIQAPTGPLWEVELKRGDDQVWFGNGWQEFVDYFSLKTGSSLVFRYEGHSCFDVLFIFDLDHSLELKYPNDSSSKEETNRDNVKEEIQNDGKTGLAQANGRDSLEASLATEQKATPLPSDGNSKSENPYFEVVMKPSYVAATAPYLCIPSSFTNSHLTEEEKGDFILQNSEGRTWTVCCKVYHVYGRKPVAHVNGGWKAFAMDNKLKVGDKCRFELQKDSKLCFIVTISRVVEDANHTGKTDLAQASGCKSFEASLATKRRATTLPSDGNSIPEHPFFQVVLKPSYVAAAARVPYLPIPGTFAERHLTAEEGDIILQNSDGKTWPVCYMVYQVERRKPLVVINGGWKDFARDNDLQEGDTCRFELHKGIKMCFIVTISRVGEDANHHYAAADEKAQGNKTSQFESGCSSKHEAVTPPSTIPLKKMKTEEHGKLPHEWLSSIGNAEAFEKASKLMINSNHPSFQLFIMSPSYLQDACPAIPTSFCNKYLNNNCINSQEEVILQVKDKSWTVRLVSCSDRPGILAGGWPAFESENNLKLGDVCVFEMINIATKPIVFKVSIFSGSNG